MIDGYSPEDVQAGIRMYAESGLPHQNACLCALRDARRLYRMDHPRGAYPAHLRKKPKTRAQREKKNKNIEVIR